SPSLMLLLVDAPGAKADAKLAKATTPLEFDHLEDTRIPKWIAHYATTECGTEITPEAADLLQRAVGNDLHLLGAELEKLASYTSGAEITAAAVGEIVGV